MQTQAESEHIWFLCQYWRVQDRKTLSFTVHQCACYVTKVHGSYTSLLQCLWVVMTIARFVPSVMCSMDMDKRTRTFVCWRRLRCCWTGSCTIVLVTTSTRRMQQITDLCWAITPLQCQRPLRTAHTRTQADSNTPANWGMYLGLEINRS